LREDRLTNICKLNNHEIFGHERNEVRVKVLILRDLVTVYSDICVINVMNFML
jgi:hypothetical protein